MEKKRFNNLSIYRIVAAICILQFHIFYILFDRAIPYETLLSKAVQGLAVLSGFLYSQKVISDYKKFYLGSLKKILIPAAICFLFMAIWNLIYMFIFQNWDYISLFLGHRAFEGGLLFQPANYYFLLYIFICYLITPILQRNNKYTVIVIVGVILLELSLAFFFNIGIIGTCYIAGYFIGKKVFNKYTDTSTKYSLIRLISLILGTAAFVSLYVVITLYPFRSTYLLQCLFYLTKNIIMSSFGVVTFFLLIYILRFANRFKENKLLIYTDRLSLIIYLFNQAYMVGAMNVTTWVNEMWAKILLVYVFVIVTSVIMRLLFDKIPLLFDKIKVRKYGVSEK